MFTDIPAQTPLEEQSNTQNPFFTTAVFRRLANWQTRRLRRLAKSLALQLIFSRFRTIIINNAERVLNPHSSSYEDSYFTMYDSQA